MKAVVISKFGAADVLEVRDWPEREPGPGEVKLRTRFAGVNFADIAARIGIYKDAPKPPCVVGYEVSGVVLAVGAGVKHVSVGDRALGLTMFGGYAGEVCTLADAVRRIPDAMSDEEAAALPVNYLTAYHMLSYLTTVRPRDRVLIHAAAGGVGIAAIQLARAAGAEIFGTASPGKHDYLRSIGVAHCIDYRATDFAEEVSRLTHGEGVDIVLDALGGADLAKSARCLRQGGRLFTFGFSRASGETRNLFKIIGELLRMPKWRPLGLMDRNHAVLGVNMNHLAAERPDVIAHELDALLKLYVMGTIRPKVDRVFPIAEAADAHRFLQARQNVGKVLLKFD